MQKHSWVKTTPCLHGNLICAMQAQALASAEAANSVVVSHPLLDRVRAVSAQPDQAADFFTRRFKPHVKQRLTFEQACQHPWLSSAAARHFVADHVTKPNYSMVRRSPTSSTPALVDSTASWGQTSTECSFMSLACGESMLPANSRRQSEPILPGSYIKSLDAILAGQLFSVPILRQPSQVCIYKVAMCTSAIYVYNVVWPG